MLYDTRNYAFFKAKKDAPKDVLSNRVLPEYKAKDFFDYARKQAAEERSVHSGYVSTAGPRC